MLLVYNFEFEYFYVDKNAPNNITLHYPYNDSQVHASTIDFNYTLIDNVSQTLECDIYIDGSYNNTNFNVQNGSYTIETIGGFTEGFRSFFGKG